MYSKVGKRSFRRACRRACIQGVVVYRGRRITDREAVQYYPSFQELSHRGGQQQNSHMHEPHGRRSPLTSYSSTRDSDLRDSGKKTSGGKKVFHEKTSKPSRMRPGEAQRSGRWCVYSWNVGGLTTAVFEEILVFMQTFDVHIVNLQETRWNFSGEWVENGFACFHSAPLMEHPLDLLLVPAGLLNIFLIIDDTFIFVVDKFITDIDTYLVFDIATMMTLRTLKPSVGNRLCKDMAYVC